MRPYVPISGHGLLGLGVALAACASPELERDAMRTDSAGVEIVRSPAMAVGGGEQWRLSPEPTLHVGVVEGPEAEQFNRISHAFWLSDGRIVAVNMAGPPQVRIFTAEGRHERSLGGSGSGPGEFAAISFAARLPGDTLVAHDFWSGRLVLLAPDGEVLRTRPLHQIAGEPANRWVVGGAFGDGSFLVWANDLVPGATPGRGRALRSLLRVTVAGDVIDTVVVFPDTEYVADRDGTAPVLFGLRSAWRLHGDRLYVAPGDAFRVDVFDGDGDLLRSLRVDRASRPVLPEHIAAEPARPLPPGSPEAPPAERFPAHGQGIRVDPAGGVWLEHYRIPGDDMGRWSVFDEGGVLAGEVAVPPNFRIMDVRNDEVLGVWTDELDVPGIRVYRLERGP